MRPAPPTFFPLDGRTGWRTDRTDGASVDPAGLLRLAADPAGPLSLTSADGTLGGLTLADWMALDAGGTVHLLSDDRVLRFNPASRRFEPLPEVGGEGTDARRFRQPAAIAVAGNLLYVVDRGNRRVQVFDLRTLALVRVWKVKGWEPVDVAAQGETAWVLDARRGRVFRDRSPVVNEPAAAGRWTRLAVDREGRIYLLDPARPRLEIYGPRRLGEARDAGEVASRFDAPAIRPDHKGRFSLPAGLAGAFFDRAGRPVRIDPAEPAGPPLFRRTGTWTSQALDSRIYRCPWHRIELELAELPPGARVKVSTHADESPHALDDGIPEHAWETRFEAVGPLQEPGEAFVRLREFLVQGGPGQHLRVRIELQATGFESPAVRGLRIHYPRQSWLAHLPAIYSADEASRSFLERFLSIPQTEWDGLERRIAEFPRLFDPAAVPEGKLLDFLAGWLGLALEGSGEERRRLLAAAPRLLARRGTVEGFRELLRIHLQNLSGVAPAEQRDWPAIVEGFRERQHLMLATPMGRGAPLWSAGVVGRLRLGVFATAGQVRLVSTGDPERDVFHEHAHRFRVFVPSAWVRTAAEERRLRRAIDEEKPAHTAYDLCLVEPRFRVEVQSTVGLDTVIGGLPVTRLACRSDDEDEPPSRPPRGRLGYDTVLSGRPVPKAVPRVGVETILT